ncbi:hypothetical protein PR048_017932 [Dryococelus australis]|uniref:Uncharacterized protein n=1 Tax=Dryococelus australis TaxID=614101 RepID=A0ABQ9HB81_9NEOP|nr:hypothetical protein PR048_017932 [Dryococelus australis]
MEVRRSAMAGLACVNKPASVSSSYSFSWAPALYEALGFHGRREAGRASRYDLLEQHRKTARSRDKLAKTTSFFVFAKPPLSGYNVLAWVIQIVEGRYREVITSEKATQRRDLYLSAQRLFKEIRGHGGVVARLLVSPLDKPGSIPGGVTPGFSYVGIVPDDAAGRRVFLGISRFLPPLNSGAVLYSRRFTLIGFNYLDVKNRPNLFNSPAIYA